MEEKVRVHEDPHAGWPREESRVSLLADNSVFDPRFAPHEPVTQYIPSGISRNKMQRTMLLLDIVKCDKELQNIGRPPVTVPSIRQDLSVLDNGFRDRIVPINHK